MPYTELEAAKGRKSLEHIWNLFFKPLTEPDFFVEPWENCELGDCAAFTGDEVWFCTNDAELVAQLEAAKEELYLFGAYNQVNVCQMRARGTVTRVSEDSKTKQIKSRLRAAITRRVGKMVEGLKEDEAQARRAIIDSGAVFCFRATAYAYDTYERG